MKLKTWLMLGIALAAAYMAKRSLARQPEVITLLWAVIGLSAAATTANTPKARSTEQRLSGVISQVGTTTSTANSAQSTANSAQSLANTVDSRTSGLNIPVGRGTGLTAAPSSYNQTWGNSVVSFCTQLNNQLQAAGIFN